LYKYATHSSNVETLSASRKQSEILCGDEVGEYIFFVVILKEVSSKKLRPHRQCTVVQRHEAKKDIM
jgi:hypothetical protein